MHKKFHSNVCKLSLLQISYLIICKNMGGGAGYFA